MVFALVMPWLSRLINRRRAALVAIPAIFIYTLLVGASASVVRASAMAIIVLVGLLFWRPADAVRPGFSTRLRGQPAH
jgi:predicted membrane metal-binding protein